MPYIKTRDGADIYVKDWGEGRPVVLIHGWPLSSDSWDPQMLALAEAGYRAIAYDRRGFGRSSQPWNGYDYNTLTDDLADVLQATGATDGVTLVGFSMGGGEVARYMSRHEGKGVVSAALIGSVVPYMLQTDDNPDGVPEKDLLGIAQGIRENKQGFFQTMAKNFYGVGVVSHPVDQAQLDWFWMQSQMAGLRPILGCAEAFSFTDFRPDLPAFRVPTLVLHGTGDAVVPVDVSGRQAAAKIAGAQLVEYDGAPHGLFASHGERLTKDLLTFVGG